MAETRRVELKDGHWADVRTTSKMRDVAEQRIAAVKRGVEDEFLDAIVLTRTRIVEWSRGDVSDEAVLDLDQDDWVSLFRAVQNVPNGDTPSPTSPAGTPGTKRTRGNGRKSRGSGA